MSVLGPVNPDALTEWEERFRPVATRYRDRKRGFLLLLFAGLAVAAAALLPPGGVSGPALVVAAILTAAGMVLAFTIPSLRCPHCDHQLERLARFCPRCSADAIQIRVWRGNRCGGCGKGLSTHRGRHFPICYCSRCGVLVDRLGV